MTKTLIRNGTIATATDLYRGDVLIENEEIACIGTSLSVEADRTIDAAPSGTAIILFADIADSTMLTERMGDTAFRAKARELDSAMRAVTAGAAGASSTGAKILDRASLA